MLALSSGVSSFNELGMKKKRAVEVSESYMIDDDDMCGSTTRFHDCCEDGDDDALMGSDAPRRFKNHRKRSYQESDLLKAAAGVESETECEDEEDDECTYMDQPSTTSSSVSASTSSSSLSSSSLAHSTVSTPSTSSCGRPRSSTNSSSISCSTASVAPCSTTIKAEECAAPVAAAATGRSKRKWSSETREAIVSVLACVLERLFSNPSDSLPSNPNLITCFHTDRVPSISIGQYLERIAYYSDCSEECLISAVIQISRIYYSEHSPLKINSLSIHRLLLTSVLVNGKFHDDHYFNNAFFGRIGGVSAKEMNVLEVEFLALVAFDLFVSPSVYSKFYSEITNSVLHSSCCCSSLLPHIPSVHDMFMSALKCEAEQTSNVGVSSFAEEQQLLQYQQTMSEPQYAHYMAPQYQPVTHSNVFVA